MGQHKGTVRWFNNVKGYGFLSREDGKDVFVHFSSIKDEGYKSLKEGEEVVFDIVEGEGAPSRLRRSIRRCPATSGCWLLSSTANTSY